jgi:Ca2+-transporting ATPase
LVKSGRALPEAMALTFVSLVLIQFFKAYSFRSDREPLLWGALDNRWLNVAIMWELALMAVVIYAPPLQAPFGTFAITATDWLIVVMLAASIVPVLETVKWTQRRSEGGKR